MPGMNTNENEIIRKTAQAVEDAAKDALQAYNDSLTFGKKSEKLRAFERQQDAPLGEKTSNTGASEGWKGKAGGTSSGTPGNSNSTCGGASSGTGASGGSGTSRGSTSGISGPGRYVPEQALQIKAFKSSRISDGDQPSINPEDITSGAYNAFKNPDITPMEEAVIQTGKSAFSDSDAAQGYSQTRRYASMFGVGSTTRAALKYSIENDFYRRTRATVTDENTLQDLFGGENKSYRMGINRSGNVFNDYRSNINEVEKFLDSNGINAKNLSLSEIQGGIDNLELSNPFFGTIKFDGDDPRNQNIVIALKELKFLREQGAKINYYRRMSGGLKNTVITWGREAFQDSDAYKGYQTTKTGLAVAKGGTWIAKGAGAATADAAVTAVELGSKAAVTGMRGFAKGAGAISKVRFGADSDSAAKWKSFDQSLGRTSTKISVTAGDVKKKVNSVALSSSKDKAKWVASNTIGRTGMAQRFSAGMNRVNAKFDPLRKSRMKLLAKTKILRAPFNAISAIQSLMYKIMLAGAALILMMVMLVAVCIPILSLFPNSAEPVNGNVDNSVAQRTINFLYSFQDAYEENIYQCEAGSIYADKGIPSTWKLVDTSDASGTGSIHDRLTAVYDAGGKLLGYNLSRYWGPADREYQATVLVGYWVPATEDTPGYWAYKPELMTLTDIAGLEGDMGTYSVLDAPVDKGSEAYMSLYHKTNPDVTVNFNYKGSSFSYDFTGNKASAYESRTGETVDYSIDILYKAFLSMAIAYVENGDESYEFFSAYCKQIFDKVMESAVLTLSTEFELDPSKLARWKYVDPPEGRVTNCVTYGYKAHVTLDVFIDDSGLQDIIALDPVDNTWSHSNGSTDVYKVTNPAADGYTQWDGWFEGMNPSEAHEVALEYFELAEDDWEEIFYGVTFPGNTAKNLADSMITDIVSQISASNGGLDADRQQFIEFALSCVGRFYYKYGSGHPISDLDNPPTGLDCSGFVSYALYMGGVDDTYESRNASTLAEDYTGVPFNGDYTVLEPGTIIVKNNIPGGAATSSNHVVIYLGYIQLEGDPSPRHYSVECTTTMDAEGRSISGVQLTSQRRMNAIKYYNYARDPFQ